MKESLLEQLAVGAGWKSNLQSELRAAEARIANLESKRSLKSEEATHTHIEQSFQVGSEPVQEAPKVERHEFASNEFPAEQVSDHVEENATPTYHNAAEGGKEPVEAQAEETAGEEEAAAPAESEDVFEAAPVEQAVPPADDTAAEGGKEPVEAQAEETAGEEEAAAPEEKEPTPRGRKAIMSDVTMDEEAAEDVESSGGSEK